MYTSKLLTGFPGVPGGPGGPGGPCCPYRMIHNHKCAPGSFLKCLNGSLTACPFTPAVPGNPCCPSSPGGPLGPCSPLAPLSPYRGTFELIQRTTYAHAKTSYSYHNSCRHTDF